MSSGKAVIERQLTERIINDQQVWLNELGHLSTKYKSPIMVQYSQDLKQRWMAITGNLEQLVIARTILPNEIVFDFDQKDWDMLKTEARKLVAYLDNEVIDYIMGATGGKGIHIHVFIDASTLKIEADLSGKVQEQEIDPLKIMRETLYYKLIKGSGVDPKRAGLDRSAVSWRSFPTGKGHMIREFGSLRADGSRKSFITDVPEERPTKDTIQFAMPCTVHQWDISEYSDLINGEIRRCVDVAEKDDTLTLSPSPISELDTVPCYRKLMQGLNEGIRNPGAYRIARFNFLMGIPQERAQQDIIAYAHKCQGYDSELERGCLETLKSAYKGQKSDHPGCGPIKETFGEEICDWKNCPLKQNLPSQPQVDKDDSDKKVEKKDKVDQATQLVQLAYQDGKAEYFTDARGEAFCRVKVSDHFELLNLEESTFGEWLSFAYYGIEGKVPGSESLRSAINILRGQARFGGNTRELSLRVARFDNAFWYNLSDAKRQAIRIDDKGWEIVAEPPPLFKHLSHMKPQDTPVDNGSGYLDQLLDLINVQGDDREIFKVMLITDFIPGIASYGLSLSGQQGSAKSMMLKLEKMLVDPSELEVFIFPKDEKELLRLLDRHHVVPFDNIESVTTDTSNILCGAITGTATGQRKLYTDDQDIIRKLKRIIRMNGINNEVRASDLLDRIIMMDLQPIVPDKRRTEAEIWGDFYSIRPSVLGEILSILSRTILKKAQLEAQQSKARLADWYEWGEAVASAIGMDRKRFSELFNAYIEKQNAEAIEQSLIAPVLMKIIDPLGKRSGLFLGTASDLFTALNDEAREMGLNTNRKGWPVDAARLSKKITPLIPNLKTRGYHVKRCKFEEVGKYCPDLLKNISVTAINGKSRITIILYRKDGEDLPKGWNSIGNSTIENFGINAVTVPGSQQSKIIPVGTVEQ
jgi:hypothetical protein